MTSNILKKRFPDLELSYGKTLHKKVRCDAFQLLPRGRRHLIWFTYKEAENIALLLSFDRSGRNITADEV